MLLNPYRYVTAGGGGFPTVADADTTTGTAAASTTTTITYPANIGAGDLLLLIMAKDTWAWYGSNTGGFTRLLENQEIDPPSNFLLGKVATGSESGTFTVTADSGGAVWRCLRITAASWYGGTLSAGTTSNASDGLSAALIDNGNTSGTSADPPSVSPAWGAADTLWIAVAHDRDGAAGTTYSAFPTNYTNTAQQHHGTSPYVGEAIGRRELNAASEDPGDFTLSASAKRRAMTIAIRPA